jgi:hypothetical protein
MTTQTSRVELLCTSVAALATKQLDIRLRKFFWLLAFSVSIIVLGTADSSADTFRVEAGGDLDWGPSSGAFSVIELEPIHRSGTLSDAFGSASVDAVASRGIVKTTMAGSVFAPGLQSRRFNPYVLASARGMVTFSGPTSTTPPTRPGIHLSGIITHPDSISHDHESIQVDFHYQVGAHSSEFRARVDNGNPSLLENEFTGLVTFTSDNSIGVGGDGTPLPFEYPVGVPVEVAFTIALRANHLSSGFQGTTSFSGSFSNTARWTTRGPVFDLPEGYTVNGFGIVDNQFFIPEPSTAVMLLLAVGGFVLRRRQRFSARS